MTCSRQIAGKEFLWMEVCGSQYVSMVSDRLQAVRRKTSNFLLKVNDRNVHAGAEAIGAKRLLDVISFVVVPSIVTGRDLFRPLKFINQHAELSSSVQCFYHCSGVVLLLAATNRSYISSRLHCGSIDGWHQRQHDCLSQTSKLPENGTRR